MDAATKHCRCSEEEKDTWDHDELSMFSPICPVHVEEAFRGAVLDTLLAIKEWVRR